MFLSHPQPGVTPPKTLVSEYSLPTMTSSTTMIMKSMSSSRFNLKDNSTTNNTSSRSNVVILLTLLVVVTGTGISSPSSWSSSSSSVNKDRLWLQHQRQRQQHQYQQYSDTDIQHAKDVLLSIGVPLSNLCIDIDIDIGDDTNNNEKSAAAEGFPPIHYHNNNGPRQDDILPLCATTTMPAATTLRTEDTPATTNDAPMIQHDQQQQQEQKFLSSSSYHSSYFDWIRSSWIFVPRQERRRRLQQQQNLRRHSRHHPNPNRHHIHRNLEVEESTTDVHTFDDDPWFYLTHAACALACVTAAALAAGLTIGLLSLDPLMLLIKMRAGATQREKDQAAALLPVVRQHHLLLVTLLLLNSMANEALPLFLEVLVSPVMAVILSVTFVLFFGEIIPSAVFTGPQKIELASRMVPVVRVVMFLLWPIAFPIAKVLDAVLHEEEDGAENMNRGELSALVRVQYEERMAHKRARKMEKVQYQKQQRKSSQNATPATTSMSTIAGGAATTATLTGRATPTDVVVSRIGSLNFPHPKHRSVEADAAIRASKHEEFRYQNSGSTIRSSAHSHELSRRSGTSAGTGTGAGGGSGTGLGGGGGSEMLKRSNSIHIDEVAMVEGALQMKTMTAMDVLTPLHRIYAVPHDLILNENNIVDIYSSGYSRIPVYERNPNKPKSQASIIGLLMTKHLIVVSPSENRPLSTLPLQTPPCVSPKMNLVDLVNLFQTGQVGHLALVCARPQIGEDLLSAGHALPSTAGLMGIITLEDVFEALLQEQIYDEMDQMEKEAEKIARWVCHKWRNYKAVKQAEEEEEKGRRNSHLMTMGDVVEEAMMVHGKDRNGNSTTDDESTFLLGGNKPNQSNDRNGSGGGAGGGLIGFLQSFGNGSKDGN